MKNTSFLSIVLLCFISLLGSVQANARVTQNFTDTTSKLPKGTFIKNGKVNLMPGYKVTFSEDQKIGTISRQNGSGITGSFECACSGEKGGCNVTTIGQVIICGGKDCCYMETTTSSVNLAITSKSGRADANITWNVLVIPKTNITTTSQ